MIVSEKNQEPQPKKSNRTDDTCRLAPRTRTNLGMQKISPPSNLFRFVAAQLFVENGNMGEEDLKIFLSHTKNATVSSLHDKDIDFVGTPFSRESNVGYVVDLSYVPKCGSFNPYGNEQMNEELRSFLFSVAEGLTKASGGKIVYDSIKWVNVLEEDGILDGMDVQDFMTRPSWPTYSKIPEKLKSKLEDKYGMVIEEKPAKTVICSRACTLGQWKKWIKDCYLFDETELDPVWKLLMSESEFQQKYADYDDEKFKLCLQNVLQSTQIVDVIFFCDAILKGWANQIQKSPNQRDLQNKPKEPARTLDEWRIWIERYYFPLTDITPKWNLLMNQDEFEDAFADYNDDVFKANLETILIRETRKEKSLLASFCNAILKSWDKKVANKTQIEIKEPDDETFISKRIKFEDSPSSVSTSFVSEGFSIKNFYSTRAQTVDAIVKKTDDCYSYLVHGPSFTGKTSLCSLIADELRSRGKHVVSLSMLGYSPSSHSLEEFWKIKTSRSYFDWFNHVSELYVLVDELQMTYPLRKEEIVDTYQLKNESAILAPEQHHHFFECAKVAMQNHTVKLIAFSSLGSSKIGGLLPTPINFGHSGQHYNFLENEVHELLSNFARRTQIKFISDGQVAPDFLRGFLESETNYHIGYCAAILHTINMFFLKINNEQEFKAFLYSKIYYTNLRAYRPLPSFYSINADERKALIEFWYKKEDAMSDHYTNLVKRGWIGLNSATSQVYLYCPLYRDLLMMELFCSPRPKIDQLKDVGEFMQTFLARLQRKDLEANLSKSRDDSILESWWQAEFYRIGCLILGESSTISVEVGPKANIPSGRLDFYINGTRRWAIEFLICGNTPEPEFDNRLEEHVSRFDASEGKYAALEPLEYLVVDFRPRYTPKRQEKKFSDLNHTYYRVWIVLYDNLNFVDLKLIKFSAIGVKTEEIILLY